MAGLPTFHQFALLPTELRLIIWDHAAPIPYDHRLIVHIERNARYVTAREAAQDAKAIKARPATRTRKAVEGRLARETQGAHVEFKGRISRCSWSLSNLLAVNTEARDRVLRANPNFLQVEDGPKVYFHAARNLIHLDFLALHHLAHINIREGGECATRPVPYSNKLIGFDSIVNLSVPNCPAPNTILGLRFLRGSAEPVSWNPSPVLSGVTYCERAALPYMYNTSWLLAHDMAQELDNLRQQYDHNPAQRDLILQEKGLILTDLADLCTPVKWVEKHNNLGITLHGKPQGVRVPENAL